MKNKRYIATMVGLLLMLGSGTTAYGQIVKGKVFGGGQLAQVNAGAAETACNVTINSGWVYGKVYGAGEGVKIDDASFEAGDRPDVAKVTGDVKVNMAPGHKEGGGTAWQDVFGGGALAKVAGNTYVTMSGGYIAANLFGGGEGDIKSTRNGSGNLVITSADITGNTNVDITGGRIAWDKTSISKPSSSNIITYIYTKTVLEQKDQQATEKSESNDQKDVIKALYEERGYTSVTVADPTGPVDDVYSYVVTYTIPASSDTKEFIGSKPDNDETLRKDGYELAEHRNERILATGDIVHWDINKEHGTDDDYDNNNDLIEVDGVKYAYKRFYEDDKSRFTIMHNIFGGGYIACRVGTYNAGELEDNTGLSKVTMVSGMFGGDLMKTDQWKLAYNGNQDPHFYVFGGGFGAYTSVGNTSVHIGVDDDIETDDTPTIDFQWAKPGSLDFSKADGMLGAKASKFNAGEARAMAAGSDDDEIQDPIGIYDESYGLPEYTILGVLGGGYAGIVTGNTDVMVGGNTFMHRIYGGGYGQLAAYNELNTNDVIWTETVNAVEKTYNREDLGMVMGNTYVETQGGFIHGDVFGGGAGVKSAWLDGATYKELAEGHTTAVKDFTMGVVNGITEVNINGKTEVYGNVYGGGDVACVLGGGTMTKKNGDVTTNTTDVAVVGGMVTGNVYGGGNGNVAAQVASVTTDNAVAVGAVTGNTNVLIDKVVATEQDVTDGKASNAGDVISEPDIYGSIYGGGAYGQVLSGNTSVTINAGYIGDNVFGGGLGDEKGSLTSANIAGTTNVTINGGSALWSALSDENGNTSSWNIKGNVLADDADKQAVRLALVTGDTLIFKKLLANVDSKFFDVKKLEFTKNHNIYGGGDLVCKVAGTTNVTINHALVTDATLLDPDNEAGLAWAASIDNKEHPQFSVFGGGYGPNTSVANTVVKYQCGHIELYTSTDPEVIGGTKEVGDTKFTYESQDADRTIWASYFGKMALDWAELDAKEKEQNYGGNNSAGIWRYAVSQLAWSSGIPNLIMRGVFGGGYAGLVEGNTNVTVSDNSCMRYVYGGGLGSKDYLARYDKVNAGNLYNRLGEVGGNSTVTITGGVVSKELYGGGAGIEPKKLGEDTDYTDLVDMARVKGKTSVSISGSPSVTSEGAKGTVIIGDVFGGGDVANVGTEDATITGTNPNAADFVTSQVNITSGCMLGQVFAGGNGRTKEICSDADGNGVFGYQKVGAIYGNTLLSVDGYDATSSVGPDTDTNGKGVTYIFKRMFGGGNNGSIRKTTASALNSGHTYVTVNGGYFAYNVFGGGVGTINVTKNEVTGEVIEDNNTYSYVEGDTHLKMLGGLAIVDQYWDKPQTIEVAPGKSIEIGLRQWAPLNEYEGKTYSAQYDPVAKKLLINHNIYAGCRNAGYVLGSTYLTMNKGYIRSGLRAGAYDGVATNFFESKEWEEIYNKIGSPHFCIFGGGFGENTHIKGNTYVDINIDAKHAGLLDPVTLSSNIMNEPVPAKRFEGGQSVMDIIGGGYSGDVAGATHVKVSGDVFARRIFGGSFYAPVSQTNILINSVYCDDIFGGGMMGNVEETTVKGDHLKSGCGDVNLVIGKNGSDDNKKIFISNNVFGGNDVSGVVRGQISNSILGGTIYNNVYGAGNGNYLYAINQTVNKVTAHENYESNGQTYPLVYEVPKREEMEFSMQSATDAQKIVNINTYRPNAQKVLLNLGGSAAENMLVIKGNVFGGGNTATVNNLDGNTAHTSVVMNIGSHCNIGGVYMGNDGDAMFQESNGFMDAFQKINGVDLAKSILWHDNPMDRQISELYLPVKLDDRPTIYPHVLDLYFQPVEMSLQPTLNWCSSITKAASELDLTVTPTEGAIENTTIGVFVAGGNRGNMNVTPIEDGVDAGRIVNYEFPAGLTITNRIVGGCNNANYTLGKTIHVGGYLLGKRNTTNPAIDLSVKCKFGLAEGVTLLNGSAIPTDANDKPLEQRNVYGGCYNSGTINGDINIDFRSTMLNAQNIGGDSSKEACDNIAKTYFGSEVAMGNVYGAGYGPESYVYGNTKVTVGQPVTPTASSSKGMKSTPEAKTAMVAGDEYVAMSVYGGGQQGNVIGNTTVRVLNGHIGKSVVGGSYAGYMWGSTQVIVGYPTYYIAKKGGKYKMMRADKWNTAQENHDGSKVVKQEIYVLPGDIISQEVYDAIVDYDSHNSTDQATNFTSKTEQPTDDGLGFTNGWNDINITIDEACYGGGYSLASGSSVAAGDYTVKKYDETMNITKDYDLDVMKEFVNDPGNTSTKGYGGNTTVLVWDNNATTQIRDHINISTQTMKEVVLPNGTDLFGYYHKKGDGTYGYIYQEGEYFYGTGSGSGTYYTQAFESDSEGGMYGDGHLSFAEGFRSGELVGYGFAGSKPNGAKIINTFQRMDMLRLKDCSVAVLGARDYTVNEISKTPYSLARIGELQMIADNVVVGDGSTTYKPAAGGDLVAFADGQLLPTVNPRSRNYLGLSNNIHFLGAVKSNVDFNSPYHYGNKDADKTGGDKRDNGTKNNSKTYRETKQDYVTAEKTSPNPAEFQKRNDGTAANMIGISSGYAMKLQNVYTTTDATTESYFYGPVVGVVEMNLIDVREDEGGGYVYADNIHHRSSTAMNYGNPNYDQVPTAKDQEEDFLEVSGNFVFPYDVVKNRYIVDDCFPTGFEGTEAKPEAHYWYVTGYNYYYNAHITGYTYNSSETPLYFNSDKDALLALTGAKAGQSIRLQSLKWRSNHIGDKDGDGFAACDLETDKVPGEKADGYGNNVVRQEDANGLISGEDGAGSVFEHYNYNNYNLHIGTSDNEGKYATSVAVKPADGTSLTSGYYTDAACTNSATGTANGTDVYYQKLTYWNNLPLTRNLDSDQGRLLTNTLATASPIVSFQLKDNVDNSGIEYYQKYMAQPCNATIVLTCPATEANGTTPIKGYVPIAYFFTKDVDVYTKMADNATLTAGNTYYYFGNGNDYHAVNSNDLLYYDKTVQRYVPVDKTNFTYEKYKTLEGNEGMTKSDYDALPTFSGKLESGSQDNTFYAYDDRVFTYTIYLTIDYVQGPDVSGNLKVYNCALPGEKIMIDRGTIDIKSDVSMSQTAAYWRIFKEGTPDAKKYVFDQANPFDEKADENSTSEMLKDVQYSESDKCIYVPAYYFMDGYKVEYCYRVNGIDQLFTVPSSPNDFLTVHNYHRMLPRSANGTDKAKVDFKLDLAAQRAVEEPGFAEPRIYIADAADLNELPRFLGEKTKTYYTREEYNEAKSTSLTAEQFFALPDASRVKEYGAVGTKYDFGNHMQFHLLNDITLKTEQEDKYIAPANFKGTLNGNGYVLTGLGVKVGDHTPSSCLFSANEGHIYNLGLKQGVITSGDAGADNEKYHTSYTWSNKTVYRMDGTAVGTTADGVDNTYTDNDWRYGKVTYDLNQYYLEARKAVLDGNDATVPEESASGYVKNLFHNGDYLYARWQSASPEYLRTTASQYDANYNSQTSYHRFSLTDGVLTHPVDESRAVNYNAETKAYDNYAPLFEEAKKSETAASTIVKNDYLFFGQQLNADTKEAGLGVINQTIPEHIDAPVTREVALMYNRVYRAGGYYKSHVSGEPYATSNDAFFYNKNAYVHDNGITAIDFYGYKNPADVDNYRYNPVVDYPAARLADMDRADGVTRNLLVYANNTADTEEGGALKSYVYNASTPEGNIKMHVIKPVTVPAVDPNPATVSAQTALLHLVERYAVKDGEGNVTGYNDASGAECLNNDFDAPVAFNVTQRAWYTRQPAYYAEADNSAWEGITLPFTATKVSASKNREITHFYGTPKYAQSDVDKGIVAVEKIGEDMIPEHNDKTLHHEYWLRGLTNVATADSKTTATFQRPGEGLFADGETITSYVFNNDWFVTTYGDKNYNTAEPQNVWYTTEHTYTDYKPLTAGVPYIVSFPGDRYYEFDLSNTFYNRMMSAEEAPQTVTFDNTIPNEGAPITIAVTDVAPKTVIESSVETRAHMATYLELKKDEGIYAMSTDGTQFQANAANVLPFRTYMGAAETISGDSDDSGNQQLAKGVIFIGSHNAKEVIAEEYMEPGDPESGIVESGLRIYPRGRRVIVESTYPTTITMYTIGGQLMRVLDVRPGTNTFSGFADGIYVVGTKRLYLK